MAKRKEAARKRRKQNPVVRYYRETIGELKKVTWPTRREALNLTWIVLGVTFAMSAFLGLLDVLFNRLFGLLF